MRPELLDRRTNRLARAIRRMGVVEGDAVAVVVCDEDERRVARVAVEKAGSTPVLIACDTTPEEFRRVYLSENATATVACADGVAVWRAARCGGHILGDGEGVPWWKLAELRESAEPLPA